MRVYISGPITGHADYKEKFDLAEVKLRLTGHEVINPAHLNHVMPSDATHEEYMKICLELLEMADVICLLEGWEKSHGASIEYGYARAMGKAILKEECFNVRTTNDKEDSLLEMPEASDKSEEPPQKKWRVRENV